MTVLIPQPTANLNSTPDFSALQGISGYEMTRLSSTTFSLAPGYASGQYNAKAALTYPPLNAGVPMPSTLELDITTVGALGCYPVSIDSLELTHITTFPVYSLLDTSGVNKDLSTGAVLLPTAVVATGDEFVLNGYDSCQRIGLLPVAADGTILPFIQTGSGDIRKYVLADPIHVLTDGTSATQATIDLTALNGPVPPYWTMEVDLKISLAAGTAGHSVGLTPTGLTIGTVAPYGYSAPVVTLADARGVTMPVGLTTGDNAGVDYKLTANTSTVNVYVSGWTDNLMINRTV